MVTILSWGGGVNSTAMMIGLRDLQEMPDLILFADTGGEKPHTYTYLETMQHWCQRHGFSEIVTVRNDGVYGTLERNCLETKTLPSLAYGWKSCSDKYKKRPQEKYAKSWEPATKEWAMGRKVVKLLGFDADEHHRAKIPEDDHYIYRYPLVEWGWGREDCIRRIAREGLPLPGKSACFFCPASKKREIRELKQHYPDLFDRAVAIERNAAQNLDSVKGLGRAYSWEEYINADEAQGKLFPEIFEAPCMCVD